MKIKELIELLEEESPKAKVVFEFEGEELIIDEWDLESSDSIMVVKLVEK